MADHRLIVSGELVLSGPVGLVLDDTEGFAWVEVLSALAQLEGDITVRLNSGGGFAHEGQAIYNALVAYDGAVTISIEGIAASAASLIAMAGNKVIMREGAMMMIHDPAGLPSARPTETVLARHAAYIGSLSDEFARTYARKTGRPVEEMRALMRVETWMGPDEALELGFANVADTAPPAPAFASIDHRQEYSRVMAAVQAASHAASIVPAAAAALTKEVTVTTTTTTAATTPAAVIETTSPTAAAATLAPAPQADFARDVMTRAQTAGLTLAQTTDILGKAKSLDEAKDLIIDTVAARQTQQEPTSRIEITADARDKFVAGASKALLAKAGMEGGESNEFSGLSLRELARESLAMNGIRHRGPDVMAMVGEAFTHRSPQAMHSTGDFPLLLGNVASKSMLKGYDEAPTTYQLWAAKGNLPDFKPSARVDLGVFPSLKEVPEGAEYKYAQIGERGQTIKIATYGNLFSITRQAIINDDLGAFTRIPRRMGQAARRTINKLAYAELVGNAVMADGIALFHADHNNLGAGAGNVGITMDAYEAARSRMALQKDGEAVLNIRPRYVLTPVGRGGDVRVLIKTESNPTQANPRVPNKVYGLVDTIIEDAELDVAGTQATYLLADPSVFDTIEVAFLNGIDTPALEQKQGWSIDGTEFKVRIDAGVKALDFRTMQKVPVA